jgi:hypothetical protein
MKLYWSPEPELMVDVTNEKGVDKAQCYYHALDVEKLEARVRICEANEKRWLPCPDHRDKISGECQVCKVEKLEAELIRQEEENGAILDENHELMVSTDKLQAELAQVKADLAVMCERQNSLKMAEVLGRYLDKKEEGK